MNIYVSDKEQIEMIRNWWRENGKFTIISIIAALILSIGWRFWQNHKTQDTEAASINYEQMLNHQANHQSSEVEFDVTSLQTSHPNTPYASLAAFISAQNAINANKLDQAVEKFDWVIAHAKSVDFKQIAYIRKARVMLAQKKYDVGLSLLAHVTSDTYLPLVNEVKGDILAAKGDEKGAVAAYQIALQTLKNDEPNRSFLRMKLDQLTR